MAFRYNLPTDDLVNSATVTMVDGTANADYPVNNVKDDNLAHVFKDTEAVGNQTIIGLNFGSTKAIRFGAVFHTLVSETSEPGSVRYRLLSYSDAGFSLNEAQFTFESLNGLASDGFSIDPYAVTSLSAAVARQYWAVWFTNLAASIRVGRVWMSVTSRSLTRSLRYDDFGPQRDHPAIVHQTMGATLQYPYGTRAELISGSIPCDATDYAALKTLFDVAQSSARAFPIVLDSTGSTIFATAGECLFVRFAPGFQFAPRFAPSVATGLMDVPVAFKVLDRGLTLS